MLPYPQIDPVIFSVGPFQILSFTLGPLAIRWYGLMYVLGFLAAWQLVRHQLTRFPWPKLAENLDNINFIVMLGVLLGGRLGYVLFYNLPHYLEHPFEILLVGQGGMSFHGGCLTALSGGLIYCLVKKIDFWKSADIYVVTAPIGLGLGRLGNFINGELYGQVTDQPWGMIFPLGGPLPRHPSQLYEAFLEGIVLFAILWLAKTRPWCSPPSRNWPHGSVLALFLVLYGFFRSLVEFVRQPDPQLGWLALGLTMGQLLSLVMICGGLTLWLWRRKEGVEGLLSHRP